MLLQDKIETLLKITKPQTAALKKLGINTIQELLLYFPYRYLDFSQVKTIRELKPGENVSIQATIKQISSRFSFRTHLSMAEAIVSDQTGSIKIVWFNQGYLAKSLKAGDVIFLAGMPEYYNFALLLTNPVYEKDSDFPIHTARLVPVYHLTADLYPKTLRSLVAQILSLASQVSDELPEHVVKNQSLISLQDTIRYSHFPEKLEQVQAAKKRLAFEEIFLNQLLAQQYKMRLEKKQAFEIPFDQSLVKQFVEMLPFQLTPGQKKAAWDILQDLEKPVPMNRLIEGDVGSGKTVIAFIAGLEVAASGYQVAFLAPTEILAKQHYETFKKLNTQLWDDRPKAVYCGLLTNSYAEYKNQPVTKLALQKIIHDGAPGIFIGTHALLAEKIKFKNLALVIVDEQHRFGVEQRAQLFQTQGKIPHLVSLTATPIPRTLQLAYYGELDISQIKSKPADRKAIVTNLIPKNDRTKAYRFIADQIKIGRQAFVITPLIEESESLDVKSAKTEYENLKKIFPHFSVGLLHGKMKGTDKENTMANFLANKIHILVSTSVVEVGVDAPNASVMLIEGAERFGLAQLHQFRGRVGRAQHQSYCFLFSENENPETQDRLAAFTKTQDGFALAELDLQQRGFGEMYGSQQSGWNFKYFNPSYISLIQPARAEARKILDQDLELQNYPKLKEKTKGQIVHFE